ncbi:hypothetical protein [Vreelandella populi]|uniref:hypothetical protein n=1 Tax=Vreelandella populi TaxID=2498858 RepID=UPI000F8EEFE2|nr:hypothetical protein [Halomonas populi]RUR38559.1 hypothetical protein ELY25_09355 [Halomonas populi]
MTHSNTNYAVSNSLANSLIKQAEYLDAIAQLLRAGLDQGDIKICASAQLCQRDLSLYANAVRLVAANVDHPSRKLNEVLLSQVLRKALYTQFKRTPSELDVGELFEDYASCGIDLLATSMQCLSGIDDGSRCMMQSHIWMDECLASFNENFDEVIGYWNSLESQKVAA